MDVQMDALRTEGYAPIEAYALLGNGHGSALVAADGSVDWLAVPKVDTPPLLAGILDAGAGGHLVLAPSVPFEARRRYLPGTVVLQTTFETDQGSVTVTDALTQGFQGQLPWSELARRVEATGGPVPMRWALRPGNRLATVRPWVHRHHGRPYVLAGDLLATVVVDGLGEPDVADDVVQGEAVVAPGAPALLALVVAQGKPLRLPAAADVHRRVDHTIEAWRRWSAMVAYEGPHRDEAVRSALTIKALAAADSGALAAAPTTSLPEVVGESRNFDYRFGWVRDASYMVDALTRLGLSEEVDAALSWLLRGVQQTAPDVRVMYQLDGRPAAADQQQVDLVAGYRGSGPVMVGNKAAAQAQHGSYGDLLGAVARHVGGGARLDTETGLTLATLADKLCDEWQEPDAGLWELPDDRRYTSSLVNAWAALDRAVRLGETGEIPPLHVERWRGERDRIRAFVDRECWSEEKQAYTFYAGTDDLDAAVLLAARTGFCAGDDRRLWTTIDAVRRELTADGPLLYRYTGAAKEEHAFVACTFWLVEALSYAGRTVEAGPLLDGALRRANDLGLWSEEIDPRSGELLGNFPIGLSHLAVIGAITSYAAALAHGATPPPV